jgi:uncharacterized protein
LDPLPDFSDRRSFPGTHGNQFDLILRRQEQVQNIPALLFAALLLLLAAVPTFADWPRTLVLWLFFLGDWALLDMLPRAGKSYGPPKVPALLLALARTVFAFLPWPIALVFQVLGTLLVIYGFWIEPHTIRVTRQELISPKLNPKAEPLRVLHLGDLHMERITGRERQLNSLIQSLKPDLILFSGDILNLSYLDDPVAFDHARQIMAEWQAPGGVFAVSGSPAVDLEELFPRLLEGLPMHWLRDERISLEVNGQSLDLIGLTCTHKPFIDAPLLEKLVEPRTGRFTILLYHTPDLAPHADRSGAVDLQLSGHTHAGQVRLPVFGALYAGLLYGKRFEAGRYKLNNMVLYTSRGIGLEGKGAPRVRFLAPPEIILWEIKGEKAP